MQIANVEHIKEEKKVPNLRFPGFKGEWEIKIFGDLTQDASYGMNSAAIEFDGINKYLRITDIDEKSRKFVPKPLTSPNGELEDKYRLKMGDIVFARTGASVGKCYLYNDFDGNLYYAGFLIKFSIKEYAEPYFIYSYTFGSNYMKWVQVMSMRSGQPGINSEEYKSLEFYVPSLPEQQEIASFLSAVDQKIQQFTRKKELLEQYKEGVMQKIFSREIRFKDENGNDFPDWEEKRLGDIAFINPKSKALPNTFIYIDLESVEKGMLLKEEEIQLKYAPSRAQRLLKNSDILFQTVRPYQKNNYFFEKSGDYVASTGYAQMRAKKNPLFLYQLLHYQPLVNLIVRWSTGSNYPAISPSDLRNISILVPSVPEQEMIGSFLQKIDLKMDSTNNQIYQTQQFKKGLLQQMFV